MKSDNTISIENILDKFKDENSINQIKNIEKQIILFNSREKEKDFDTNDPQIIKGKEQIIFSIISNNIQEKIDYFLDSKKNLNFELFIFFLMEQIKNILSSIIKNSKMLDEGFFKEINKNILKKKLLIITNFLLSFYDNNKNIQLNISEINSINKEDSFLISCIKIILLLDDCLDKKKFEGIFGQVKTKDNKKIINKLTVYIVDICKIFILIKKNKKIIKLNDDNITKGQIDYNIFDTLIENAYEKYMPSLILFLFDIIFKYDLIMFFSTIINNDDISKIILNKFGYDYRARYLFILLINNSPSKLGQTEQKELLKILGNNNTINFLFKCIMDDIDNKKYNEENLSHLFEEIKILYFFSILINSKNDEFEKIIIDILKKILNSSNKEDIEKSFENYINDIFKLGKKIPKHKNKIYDFIFFIAESIPNFKIITLKIFFSNLNLKKYLEMNKNIINMNYIKSFYKNLPKSKGGIIPIFFNFLQSLKENGYLPFNEIMNFIEDIPSFTNKITAKIFIENLEKFLENNNKKNIDNDINLLSISDTNLSTQKEEKEKINNDFIEFKYNIYENYLNILYKIINEIKDNINIIKNKSPFDNDVTLSSIINTNYSCDKDKENKYNISIDVFIIFIEYLSIILKEQKMFQLFISKKFLEFFPYLVKDNQYKIIPYKLLKIFFESKNNENIRDKNKEQILNILNRLNSFSNDYENNENQKLKEILLIMDTIKILFCKKSLVPFDDIIKKINDVYIFYPLYMNDNFKTITEFYNDEYHSLIKNYLDMIIELIVISNKNAIIKNNNYLSFSHENVKIIIENVIKFYSRMKEENNLNNKYFLNIIKYFIDKSLNLYKISNENNEINDNNNISENDFTLYYIKKYKINQEILKENNKIENISIISNFCIQSPLIILLLLKSLFKYNTYVKQFLEYLYFLSKINQQNIIYLLKHNLLKILFKLLEQNSSYNGIILKLLKESFKYLDKKDFCFVFGKIINLLNDSKEKKEIKILIKGLLQNIINALQLLNNINNAYCKGIILSDNKIEQTNIYNIMKIKDLKFDTKDENNNINNLIIKQEIYFFKSLKTKKLLLLRISNENENKEEYIEICLRNEGIIINENDGKMKYEDLSNYNSIFIDDNYTSKSNQELYLKLNEINNISYLFKNSKRTLVIYINDKKILSYDFKFKFDNLINIEIGYPLDLIHENNNDDNYITYNHIKIKSLVIYSHNQENVEKIYKLNLGNIYCNYLFPDELTNFKLDEKTILLCKYNNINSVQLNSVFKKNHIKSQFYQKVFFNQILSNNSLNCFFRFEKFIFILLNNSNLDKDIFIELIRLLCAYLIMNKTFINKFFAKKEFSSSLYFSLYRNAKFIDINCVQILLNVALVSNINNNLIIDILLDIKIFELLNPQTKLDLINIINKNIITKEKNASNIFYIFEKLNMILLLSSFNNRIFDELIINIIFKAFEENPKEKKLINLVEELIYILFSFSKYKMQHLLKYKNGKEKETSKILKNYFHKIYNSEDIIYIKEIISKKLQNIIIDIEIKDKLIRIINSYSSETSKKNENNILNEENNYEDLNTLLTLPKSLTKKRRMSLSPTNNVNKNYFNKKSQNFIGRFTKRLPFQNDIVNSSVYIKNNNKALLNNISYQFEKIREPSIRPLDDVIIFKGIINGRKTLKNMYKNKGSKKKQEIEIIITEQDKEICNKDCHLCLFIKKILISMYKREKSFEIYKNNLMHIIAEIFILNQNKNKNLGFKYNFSYYLMKQEGPNRIRKRFDIRIDKLLNHEYDKNYKDKTDKNKEFWKLFNFYENKEKGKYINDNLLNFFNLGQIFNINIIQDLVDEDDTYLESFNCLLFKGLSYLNSVFVLGKDKIYILSRVNLSIDNILFDAHFPISRKFWILNNYEDVLSEQCEYLSSYENNNNSNSNKFDNTQRKKSKFEKIEKGFWVYSFYYFEINEIHKRKFLHHNNAFEIFLKNGKNYYIACNLNKREKILKSIINNIKTSYKSINNSFLINNEYDEEMQGKENKNENIINNISEIQNENLIKNENMIFITDSNLFYEKSKKNKKNNFLENLFKKQKKSKFYIGSILDEKTLLEKTYEHWTLGHITTYSYLMILNTLSGRTFNDLAQYPIYPWVLSNFSTNELDFNNLKNYRDFNYPIYAQNEEVRENLALKYENFDDISGFKYHSGSHYSNAGFVCYFLIRIKPFSISNAEIQGESFDTTDRLFFDIENLSKVNEKYQELIPEIYNIPETFINMNKLDFGLNSEKKNIENVKIPLWGRHSPRIFCKILTKALESQIVSTNINNWIDLIFGYKQKGKHAEKFYNVLRDVCSRFNPEKDCENELELEQKINEICEMGINPKPLFPKPHRKRERHQKIKAFFCKNIYLHYFKAKDEIYKLKNFEDDNDIIKDMRQYYEIPYKYISKGEGGICSFKTCYEEIDEKKEEENKEEKNLIYFIINGKKELIPPSYKNFIQWENDNCFYINKPFKKIKYKFSILHMMKYKIKFMKITIDGNYIIIGYNNGIIEKYKLMRIWGPKIKKENEKISNEKKKDLKEKKYSINRQHKNISDTKALFNSLFGNKNKKRLSYQDIKKNNNIEDDEEENKNILNNIESILGKKNINNYKNSNKILFDTQFPISSSNIINSDCIILNNNNGKFIQYSGYQMNNEEELKEGEIPGYDIYYHDVNNKNIFLNKENINNTSEKNYIIFLVNSLNQIFDEISLIEICEPFSFMLITDKENYLYIIDFNTFDLIKKIDCNIYFEERIRFISICPITGDFILSTNAQIILMSINGVFITKKSNFKSKINYCFIKSIFNSDLYLFTAHENGDIMISQLIDNLNGIIFDENKFENNLLNSEIIFDLNNKYKPLKIENIPKVYYHTYNTNNNKCNEKKEFLNYIKDENNFSLIFDTLIEIKCSENALKYIKLTKNSSNLICIDSKNNLITLNYDDFFLSKKKFKDKKNIVYCNKCKNSISSAKIFCQICGKKLCSNCKIEIIVPEISLKHTKPVCDDCSQLINKSNHSLYDF